MLKTALRDSGWRNIVRRVPNDSVLYFPGLHPGGSTIKDYSGQDDDGTITGAIWRRLPSGLWYLDFDGDDKVEITDTLVNSLSTTTVGTIILWIKPADTSVTNRLIVFGDTGGQASQVAFYISSVGPAALVQVSGTTQWGVDTDSNPLSNDVWACIGLVQDGTEAVLYHNGAKPVQSFFDTTDKTKWFNDASDIDNGFIGVRSNNSIIDGFFTGGLVLPIIIPNIAYTARQMKEYCDTYRHLFGV